MKICKLLISGVIACVLISILSCSYFNKKEAHTPLNNPFLEKLPVDSIGFFSLDTRSEAFNSYKTGPWMINKKSFLEKIKNLQFGQGNESLDSLLKVLEQTGLVTTTASQPEAVANVLGYMQIDQSANLPIVALYLNATEGTNFKDKLHAIEILVRDLKLEVAREDIGVADCFSIKGLIKQAPLMQQIFVAADKERMAITNSISALLPLFDDKQKTSGYEQLRNSQGYRTVVADLENISTQLVFAYLDSAKLTTLVKPLIESGNSGQLTKLSDSPIESVAYVRSVSQAMHDFVRVAIKSKTQDQERWLKSFNSASTTDGLQQIPADSFLAIAINGGTLAALKDSALSESMSAEHAKQTENLKLVDSIKDLSLGIRNAKGASPFPEIFIAIRSENTQEIAKNVQEHILSLSAENMPGLEWRTKEIDKFKFSYIFHPLGFGLYLAQIEQYVLIASSEQALLDVVATAQSDSTGVYATLTEDVRQALTRLGPVALVQVSFGGLATLIEGIQTNLAMFTGGQSALSTNEISELRQMGVMSLGLAYKQEVLKMDIHYTK